MRILLIGILMLLVCSSSFGQEIRMSKYLQDNLKTEVMIVIEGDKLIEKNKIGNIINENISMKEKLYKIADVCDYEIIKNDNDYLFVKQYSEANEVPCVTPEELSFYGTEVNKFVISLFKAHKDVGLHLRDFILALSDEEWREIKSDGISYGNLSLGSKSRMSDMFLETFYGTLYRGSILAKYLSYSENDKIVIKSSDREEIAYLMYQVNKIFEADKWSQKFEWGLLKEDSVSIGNNKTDYKSLKKSNISFYECPTLKDIFQWISADNKEISFYLSDKLYDKPISIVGYSPEKAVRLVRDIGKIYDLKIDYDGKKIGLLPKKIKRKNMDFGANIFEFMPRPLRKYIQQRPIDPIARRIAWTLLPDIQKEKTKKLRADKIDQLRRVGIALNVSSRMISEVKDNDMRHLDEFIGNKTLSFKFEPSQGMLASFTVFRDVNGKRVSGPKYTTSMKINRN